MNLKISPGSIKSAMLVLVQFSCLFILGFSGKLIPENIILTSIIIFSILLALWAMIIMKFNFNAAPEVLPGVTLKTGGPYNLIRHPMYASIFGVTVPWIINDFSYFRVLIFLVLLINQIIKMHNEEKILSDNFPEYKDYMKRTKKIIPFIF
jgi:protein-S-isoprenylcysteine O-methyltransferase Ste14